MEREQLLAAIAAQEQLRGVVPDDVIDTTITALHNQLEAAPVRTQRRRQVTVLFADVSGFTEMMRPARGSRSSFLRHSLKEPGRG